MTKAEAAEKILKVIRDSIPELKSKEIDLNKPYSQLGISSLDLVDVAGRIIREMNIKLQPNDLAKAKNINELADLLIKS